MASGQAVIRIAPLTGQDQIRAAVQLQKQIWGFEDVELLPVRLFVVAQKIGGQGFGAYDGEKLVGFCLAIPGLKPGGRYYLHSHMLGVAPEYRNVGVGRLLKLRQRDDALERGVELMEWTFDPLEIKNAYFNMERLGCIVHRFVRNQYGTTSSHLHGGLPTDRCTAEWWMRSERVEQVLAGRPVEHGDVEARISVPVKIAEMRAKEPKRAARVQAEVSDRFEEYFGLGLAVVGFEKSAESGTYLLGKSA